MQISWLDLIHWTPKRRAEWETQRSKGRTCFLKRGMCIFGGVTSVWLTIAPFIGLGFFVSSKPASSVTALLAEFGINLIQGAIIGYLFASFGWAINEKSYLNHIENSDEKER